MFHGIVVEAFPGWSHVDSPKFQGILSPPEGLAMCMLDSSDNLTDMARGRLTQLVCFSAGKGVLSRRV